MATPQDATEALSASIAGLGQSIDRANLRLDLTREALRAALQSELQYRLVVSAIERAVNGDDAGEVGNG